MGLPVWRAMLSRIERGESSPTAQLLAKICGDLGVTLSILFAGAEAPAQPLRDAPTSRPGKTRGELADILVDAVARGAAGRR